LKKSRHFEGVARGILISFVGLLFYVTVRFAQAVPWGLLKVAIAAASFGALVRKVESIYVILTGTGLWMMLSYLK
jgi:hypothetical protein